jgi:predicted Na+-dependent transporter
MYDIILISLAVLVSLALTYVGLYLAVRPLRHEHRKRIVILFCFVCSAVALMAAMYIGSKNG